MNDCDQELLEAELRKLTPAQPPPDLMARLSEVPAGLAVRQPSGAFAPADPIPKRQMTGALQDAGARNGFGGAALVHSAALEPHSLWRLLWRWLAPAVAVAALVAALLAWWNAASDHPRHAKPVAALPRAASKTDEIEIDRQLVALFDAVAQLPSGQPVRFRCREWSDKVVVRDPARGLVIERRTPRLEMVPVSFETY